MAAPIEGGALVIWGGDGRAERTLLFVPLETGGCRVRGGLAMPGTRRLLLRGQPVVGGASQSTYQGGLGAGERLSASLYARSVPPVDSDGCSSAATALSDGFSSGAALSFCVALLRDEVEKRRCSKDVFRVVVGDDEQESQR